MIRTSEFSTEQREFLKAIEAKREQKNRQRRALRTTVNELEELVRTGVNELEIPPTTVAKAAGLTPSRIWQIRKGR